MLNRKLPKFVTDEITQRYRGKEPLNLSAIKREAPKLLDHLFNPKRFVGWFDALMACGISPGHTVVAYQQDIPSLLCDFQGQSLMSHLSRVIR